MTSRYAERSRKRDRSLLRAARFSSSSESSGNSDKWSTEALSLSLSLRLFLLDNIERFEKQVKRNEIARRFQGRVGVDDLRALIRERNRCQITRDAHLGRNSETASSSSSSATELAKMFGTSTTSSGEELSGGESSPKSSSPPSSDSDAGRESFLRYASSGRS